MLLAVERSCLNENTIYKYHIDLPFVHTILKHKHTKNQLKTMASLSSIIAQKLTHLKENGIEYLDNNGSIRENPTPMQKVAGLVMKCRHLTPRQDPMDKVAELLAVFLIIGNDHPEWKIKAEAITAIILDLAEVFVSKNVMDYPLALEHHCTNLIFEFGRSM